MANDDSPRSGEDPAHGEDSVSHSAPEVDTATHGNSASDRDSTPNEDSAFDGDSALGDDLSVGTTDPPSSLVETSKRYGREYSGESYTPYLFPIDKPEQDRQETQHEMIKSALDGEAFLAPTTDTARVLDAGTGTGVWALEFAEKHPRADVYGVDISPLLPGWVAPNSKFEMADLNTKWTFNQPFDFIFMRMPFGWVRDLEWLCGQVFESLTPGGYFEVHDLCPPTSFDESIPDDSALRLWIDQWCKALRKQGCNPFLANQFAPVMRGLGFETIIERMVPLPQGLWPKDPKMKRLGAWNLGVVQDGIRGFTLAPFIEELEWSETDVEQLLHDVERELPKRSIHAYWPLHVIVAQKPGEEH